MLNFKLTHTAQHCPARHTPAIPALQLRNTTQLALDIGVQTPMGLVMEPQPLGTLRPGGAMWLPALRAHSGLLCVRPTLTSSAAAAHAAATLPLQPPQQQHPQYPPPMPPQPAGGLQTAATWQPGGSRIAGHSRIPAMAADSLAAAAALVAGAHAAAAAASGAPQPPANYVAAQRVPSSPLLYATAGLASPPQRAGSDAAEGARHLPAGGTGAAAPTTWHPYDWSSAVSLQALLRQVAGAEAGGRGGASLERNRGARQLTCTATSETQPPVLLCMGAKRLSSKGSAAAAARAAAAATAASAVGTGGSWEVLLSAPLTLHNALPVPADVQLLAWGKAHRLLLQPNQHAALHAVDAAHVEHLTLRALGYHPTRPITPPALPATAAEGGSGNQAAAAAAQHGSSGGTVLVAPDTEVYLQVSNKYTT